MPFSSRTYPLRRWLSADGAIACHYARLCIVNPFATSTQRQRANHASAMPHLSAERPDGTLEDISEEELYRYTRHNENLQLSKRYLKFDLQQLLKAAVSAVSNEGARYCTRVLKCREGLNNKAYLLTMDNGSEVFAKLPNPVAGPAYFMTASEVATREFLRDALDIPIPRIIAWSADRNNQVGAEYILEEKAPGKPLGSLWYQWPMKSKLEMISQIVKIEHHLASTKFVKSGSIYFKGTIPDISGDNALKVNVPLRSSLLGRFQIGPLVSSGLWRGERADMDMSRGPYDTPLEFVEAIARNEIQFIKAHAHPRMNYHKSSTEPELPAEVLDLLDRYLQLTPAMVPPLAKDDTHSPTLWHPDLHLDNVFVDPESRQITRIIDWQYAAVMPLYYQSGVPIMFRHPGVVASGWAVSKLPRDYDSLDESQKAKIDSDRMSETCHKYYEAETKSKNARHWACLTLDNAYVRTEPSRLAVNVWEDQDVFFLRRALLSIIEHWEDLCPESGECPVSFNKQQIALHASEEDTLSDVGEILRIFQENWGIPPNGMIDPTVFNQIRTAVAESKASFLEMADDEVQKEFFARIWPYKDADTDN